MLFPKIALLRLTCVLLVALSSSAGVAKTSVWKVSKGSNILFIGGTIHLLSERDYPLPSAFDHAFDKAQILIFETDIAMLSLPSNQAKLTAAFQFQDDRTLKGVLSEKTFSRLSEFLTERQIPIDNFAKFTPSGISIALTLIELQRIGITAAGVDQHFAQKAINTSKETGFLESIDEQIGFLKSFSKLDGNKIVDSSLRDLASIEADWQPMLDSWRAGDIEALAELAIDKMQGEFPGVYQFLLVDRNTRWLKKIEAMLDSDPTELVLVGALHLAGDDSVLEMLIDRGYTIEQMDNTQ